MATYIATLKFTEQGLKKIGQSTKRANAMKNIIKKAGGNIIASYWTLGTYDGALIFEAPDDAAATTMMLKLSLQGNVKTSTTRAFTAEEFETIVKTL